MPDWIKKIFIERADLFMKLMNARWVKTEQLAHGMINILRNFMISRGQLLDLCCGNGRTSIYMAKKGFKTTGIDISKPFLEDARTKAKKHEVSHLITFIEGDVRKLKHLAKDTSKPFDVVTNVWTSIGFYSEKDDLHVFEQARQLSRKDAILFIAETIHTEFLSLKFAPTAYATFDDIIVLEDRKYDPVTAHADTCWSFYKKQGENLEFIDRTEISHHVYNLSELCALLKKAGWETIATYGNLSTLQPMTPLTSMNIVAKAV